jgi:excisionase family DNA binding protein
MTSNVRPSSNVVPGNSANQIGEVGPSARTARAFAIKEFCRRYAIGRTTAYAEIAAGRLLAVKVGKRTLITYEAAEAWLASLPQLKRQESEKNLIST